jgi:hypothetical protein
MKISIDSSIRNMLADGDYQGENTLYNLHKFPMMDGRILTIGFTSPKGATVGIVIDNGKHFAVTINNYFYTDMTKASPDAGLFSDTEEIPDDQLRGLVEEALAFLENLFGVEVDARRRENEARHRVAMKKLLDQL